MNVIEQIFGFPPDGGSGLIGFLLLAVPVIALSLIHWTRAPQGKRKM